MAPYPARLGIGYGNTSFKKRDRFWRYNTKKVNSASFSLLKKSSKIQVADQYSGLFAAACTMSAAGPTEFSRSKSSTDDAAAGRHRSSLTKEERVDFLITQSWHVVKLDLKDKQQKYLRWNYSVH